RVFGGAGIAVKVLAAERATRDKRKRFKNEIAFLQRNQHANIVTVLDHGVATEGDVSGPFYVMRRYDSNLRDLMKLGIPPAGVLPLLGQVLKGVEAAHLKGATHRDLKPENILCEMAGRLVAVADFGTAAFTDELLLATMVETSPHQRVAN